MRIGKLFNHSILVMLMIVSVCCMILVIMSMFNLPDIPIVHNDDSSKVESSNSKDGKLGIFGEMMVAMLPNDLAFTVFVPSEKAFERVLRLGANRNFSTEEWDNAYATVSHVLGFSAVPRKIFADLLPLGKHLSYDSVSGFALYISKGFDGVLEVNRVRAEQVYIKKGEVVVYVMDGVIMDAEFEQSFRSDDDDDDEEEDAMTVNE